MTKPKSAGEIAEQLWAEGYLCDPDGPDDGVLTIGDLRAAVAQIIDSATCCGCAGLREALEKISKGTRWNPLNSTGRSPSWDAQTALEALAQPCTCQGATGEEWTEDRPNMEGWFWVEMSPRPDFGKVGIAVRTVKRQPGYGDRLCIYAGTLGWVPTDDPIVEHWRFAGPIPEPHAALRRVQERKEV